MLSSKSDLINQQFLALFIKLLSMKEPDFHNLSFKDQSFKISYNFNFHCSEKDLENYYSIKIIEDYELESRKIENNYYDNIDIYENRDRFA